MELNPLLVCSYSLLTVPFYVCGEGYFGKVWAAYGQQDIQYTEWMIKYWYNYLMSLYVERLWRWRGGTKGGAQRTRTLKA
jgi:hypothetical protein